MSIRGHAAQLISQVAQQHRSMAELLPTALQEIKPEHRPLFQELCYGSLRWYISLDRFINSLLDKPLKQKDADIHALLICGAYQISFSRIPDHAALNETVAAVNFLGKSWARGLVNAILRRYLREESELKHSLDKWQRHAHPKWLVEKLENAWGEAQAIKIMVANNTPAPMTLRNNKRKQGREDYLTLLQKADIPASAVKFSSQGIQLGNACSVEKLPGFFDGLCSVQDEAAQLCSDILKPENGELVLDACSAPGGKACAMLENADISLSAVDISPTRLEKVEENLKRLGLSATVITANLSENTDWWDGKQFDRILLDAPCSATGVIRRHPDIKLLRKAEDIDHLAQTQLNILGNLWPLLKNGGQLLYATCSILPEENEHVITEFLNSQTSAKYIELQLNCGEKQQYGVQMFPRINGHDGFYYCLLEKTINNS